MNKIFSDKDFCVSYNGKVVTTNGCFDLLHYGHVRCLQQAKQLGDFLVVLLNSDNSIKAIKGDKRPIIGEDERAGMLEALECVDCIILMSDIHPGRLLDAIKPDIHVKAGHDFSNSGSRRVVESHGGICVSLPLVEGVSASAIIEKIQKLEAGK